MARESSSPSWWNPIPKKKPPSVPLGQYSHPISLAHPDITNDEIRVLNARITTLERNLLEKRRELEAMTRERNTLRDTVKDPKRNLVSRGTRPDTAQISTLNQTITIMNTDQSKLKTTIKEKDKRIDTLEKKIKDLQRNARAPRDDASSIARLQNDLRREEQNHASLRSDLQLGQDVDPSVIVTQFTDLTGSIQDFSYAISDVANQRFPERTMKRAFNHAALGAFFDASDVFGTLDHGRDGVQRPIDDFLEYTMRHIISFQIYNHIFRPFHPGFQLDSRMATWDACMQKTYAQMSRKGMH